MSKKKSWRQLVRNLCAIVMLYGILLPGADSVCTAEDSSKRAAGPTKTAEVNIQKKMATSLLTKELRLMKILRDTVFFDQFGRQIPYEDLSVPCKAVLVYEPVPRGDSLAVSVTVKQLLPGSNRAFEIIPE
ncbi:MAG: hypothetical protein CVU64_07270 [Deltaproteobacteria bacterium HGW-Deltaproteobacteria-21]|nr:MAG: hypothetical protein CVU64_07270 [Deltaproteobacteria bacterium HGW-Deltaproteobacteria-21]